MPTKQRVSGRSLFPNLRRSVHTRGPAESAPRSRQQTITQMDPFHSIFHPDLDVDELRYEKDVESVHESPARESKRRKISTDEAPRQKASTRSMKNSRPTSIPQSKTFVQCKKDLAVDDQLEQCEDFHGTKRIPPPPKTPVSKKKKEIPSSQSPAETPLSTQSRRSIRNVSTSPLKERSTNVITQHGSSTRKSVKWAVVREIPDSFEHAEDRLAIPSEGQGYPRKLRKTAEEIYEELMAQQASISEPPDGDIDGVSALNYHRAPRLENLKEPSHRIPAESLAQAKTEVIDSEGESDGDDQKAETHAPIEATTASYAKSEIRASNQIPYAVPSSIPEGIPSTTTPHSQPPPEIDVPSSQPDLQPSNGSTENSKSSIQTRRTTQEQASDQLHTELFLSTQACGGLVTESQCEASWIPYEHAQLTSPIQQQSKNKQTPIPPSQATTVDTTQTSRSTSPQVSLERSNDPSHTPQLIPPPPSPPAPFSSSPLLNREWTSPRKGYDWDGRILTDSQLLPASLMEESIVGPMGFGVEELEEWV